MPIELKFPNGRVASFPDNTPDEQIESTLNAFVAQQGPGLFTEFVPPPQVAELQEEVKRSTASKDLQAGAAQIGEDFGTIAKATGIATGIETLQTTGQSLEDFFQTLQPKFTPAEVAQLEPRVFDRFEREGLVAATSLAFEKLPRQLTQLAPQVLGTILAGAFSGGIGSLVAGGAQAATRKLAVKGAAALGAGAFGGAQEGAGSFRETESLGGSPEEASFNAFATTIGTGLLNSIGPGIILSKFPKSFIGGLGQAALAGGVEGVTEFLEEPAQAALLISEGFDVDFVARLKAGVDVILPAAVFGTLGGGFSAAVQGLTGQQVAEGEEGAAAIEALSPQSIEEIAKLDLGPTLLLSEPEIEALANNEKRKTPGIEGDLFTQGILGQVKEALDKLPGEVKSNPDLDVLVDTLLDPENPDSLSKNARGFLQRLANERTKRTEIESSKSEVLHAILETDRSLERREAQRALFGKREELVSKRGIFSPETEQALESELFTRAAKVRAIKGEPAPEPVAPVTFKFNEAEEDSMVKAYGLEPDSKNLFISLAEIAIASTAKARGLNPRDFMDKFVEKGPEPTKLGTATGTSVGENPALTPESMVETVNEAGAAVPPTAEQVIESPAVQPQENTIVRNLPDERPFALSFSNAEDRALFISSQSGVRSPEIDRVKEVVELEITRGRSTADPLRPINIQPIDRLKAQQPSRRAKGALDFESTGKTNLGASVVGDLTTRVLFMGLTNPDFSTAIHELHHFIALTARGDLREAIEKGMAPVMGKKKKISEWTVDDHEAFAVAGEQYLLTGLSPNETMQSSFALANGIMKNLVKTGQRVLGAHVPVDLKSTYAILFAREVAVNTSVEMHELEQAVYGALRQTNRPKLRDVQVPHGLPEGAIDLFEDSFSDLNATPSPNTQADRVAMAMKKSQNKASVRKLIKEGQKDNPQFNSIDIMAMHMSVASEAGMLDAILGNKNKKEAQEAYDILRNKLSPILFNYRSEAGRILYGARINIARDRLFEALLSKDYKKLSDRQQNAIQSMDWNSLEQIENVLAEMEGSVAKRLFLSIWFNGILSSPKTFLGINPLSNFAMQAWASLSRFNIVAFDKLFAKLEGRPSDRTLHEAIQLGTHITKGIIVNSASLAPGVRRGAKPKGAEALIATLKGEEVEDANTLWDDTVGRFVTTPIEELVQQLEPTFTVGGREFPTIAKPLQSLMKGKRGKIIGGALAFPTRALRGMDLWFKAIATEAEAKTVLTRMETFKDPAQRTQFIQGLEAEEKAISGRAFTERADEKRRTLRQGDITEDAFNKELANLIAEFRGKRFAELMTFQDSPGAVTEALLSTQRGVDAFFGGFPVGTITIPFIRISMQLAKRAAEFIPGLGLNTLNPFRKTIGTSMFSRLRISNKNFDKMSEEEQQRFLSRLRPEVMARQVEGLIIALFVGKLVSEGFITGAPPEDPGERDAFFRLGKLPYAFDLSSIGGPAIEYRRLDPFGTAIAITADLVTSITRFMKDAGDPLNPLSEKDGFEAAFAMFTTAASAMTHTVIETSFLESVLNFTTSERELERSLARLASTVVPYNSLIRGLHRQFIAFQDPEHRVPILERSFLATFGEVLPIVIPDDIQARVDVFGEIVTRPGGFLREWFPLRFQTITVDDLVENEFQSLQFYPRPPTATYTFRNQKARFDKDIHRDLVIRTGLDYKERVRRLISIRGWESLSRDIRLRRLDQLANRVRSRERNRALREQVRRLRALERLAQ